MGFIEDERRRLENLAREAALNTPVRREERERLWAKETALRRGKLLEKSRAYFRESSTPKLIDELSTVVKGEVLLSEHPVFARNREETFDSLEEGAIWLRLTWDGRPAYPRLGSVESELSIKFSEIIMPDSNSFTIYKSIGICFLPSGSIRYLNGINVASISSRIDYQQWKGNKAAEETNLERVFKNPGEYLRHVQKRYSEGSPTTESVGPGF